MYLVGMYLVGIYLACPLFSESFSAPPHQPLSVTAVTFITFTP